MTQDELRVYKREWMRRLRSTKLRVFIKTGTVKNHGYKEEYIERPKDMPQHCRYCTMLLEAEWHQNHPCPRYEVVMILTKEAELN